MDLNWFLWKLMMMFFQHLSNNETKRLLDKQQSVCGLQTLIIACCRAAMPNPNGILSQKACNNLHRPSPHTE